MLNPILRISLVLIILVSVSGCGLSAKNKSAGSNNINGSSKVDSTNTSKTIFKTSTPEKFVNELMSALSSKDGESVNQYVEPSYRNSFKNIFKPITILNAQVDNFKTRSQSGSQLVEGNLNMDYAYGSGSSSIQVPVLLTLNKGPSGDLMLTKFELKQQNSDDYNKVEEFYKAVMKGEGARESLKLTSIYNVRLWKNNKTLVFDSKSPVSSWLAPLEKWLTDHPLKGNVVYNEKTSEGNLLVIPFPNGDLLYIGFSKGRIYNIFAGPVVVDPT